MTLTIKGSPLWVRHIALPQDHGSWVFLFSPLLIGIFAAERWTGATLLLVLAALAAFLSRQPTVMAVKALSGRRARRDLAPAVFWMVLYAAIGLASLVGLILEGFVYLVYLVAPGLIVFTWHLYLVSRRRERRQMGVELVGAGVLALAAPAALWVGKGYPDPQGWQLFFLIWLQSAASIVYAYLRLDQRILPEMPSPSQHWKMGRRALLYTTFNLAFAIALGVAGVIPAGTPLPFALQWLESGWGALFRPAVGFKPTRIGVRQLIVSSLFTILFIITWNR